MNVMLDKARELFDAATSIARPLREAYVRRHASDDEALMNEVLRLLEFDEPTTDSPNDAARGSPGFGSPPGASAMDAAPSGGSLVKGYRLIERQQNWLDGELWLAEPEDTSTRPNGGPSGNPAGAAARGPGLAGAVGPSGGGRVFLSVLPRPDSIRAALSRWKLIRPQLDAVTSPTIARILEAGRTADDRLFLVMPVFLPLTLGDWLQYHNPSSSEMLAVVTRLEAALSELAGWGILHGNFAPGAIRLRVPPRTGPTSPESAIEVQLVGAGVTQILASHTLHGRALSVKADHADLAGIAGVLAGALVRRSQPIPEPDAGSSPASSPVRDGSTDSSGQPVAQDGPGTGRSTSQLAALLESGRPAAAGSLIAAAGPSIASDRAFRTLARLADGSADADGTRATPGSARQEESAYLSRALNNPRSMFVSSLAAATAGAATAAAAGVLGGMVIPAMQATSWPWITARIGLAALAGGVVGCVALLATLRERKE